MDENQLINKILARDRRALYIFYHSYSPRLARYIESKVGSREDAEEILQDALMASLEALRDFHGKSTLETFLFAIASHKIVDFYRRRRFKQVVFSQAPQLEALISPLLNPEEELDVTLLKEKINRVMVRLLPHYRQILIFKYLDDLSVGEIAHKLAITFKSAESQLFRARKAFVELFLSI
ncbi:MAG: RNA polymerase sigma factor [Patescibacteria group bacterium]